MNYFENFLGKIAFALSGHANRVNLHWFRTAVYAVLLLKMLLIWPELPSFHHHALEIRDVTAGFRVSKLILLPIFDHYIHLLWFLCCAVIFIATIYRRTWLYIIVFIISLNYLSLAYLAFNSGDKLLNFFVFALIFVDERIGKNEIKQMINNATALILKINVGVLYFINGYGKIKQIGWRDGSFMKEVWQIEYYANHYLIPNWFFNPTFCFAIAWCVMLFELSFMFLIWMKPIRKWLIPIGLIFHIFIAAFLSLPDFGLTMMAVYLLFVDKMK